MPISEKLMSHMYLTLGIQRISDFCSPDMAALAAARTSL